MYLFIVLSNLLFQLFLVDSPDAVIKNYETRIVFESNGVITYKKILLQINNTSGNGLGRVEIPHDKGNRIKDLDARLIDNSGTIIRTLKKKDVLRRNSIEESYSYGDSMVDEFQFIHNSYPYFIEYSYTLHSDEFIYFKWFSSYRNLRTLNSKLSVEVSSNNEVNFYPKHIDNKPDIKNSEKSIKYTWLLENSDPIIEEAYGPDWTELCPSVTMVPQEFKYNQRGNSSSWISYGNWVYSLAEQCNDISEVDFHQIKRLVGEISDKKEITRILYNYLQDETRYINVTLGVGGMKPYPASYVLENKFGDCKALTYFMKSMLELYHIPSYPIDVYWSNRPRQIDKTIPTQQFNHVFLCVPLGQDTLWLENTSKSLPFNYLDMKKRGQHGLLIQKDSSRIIRLPQSNYNQVLENQNIFFEVQSDLKLNGLLRGSFRGNEFETLKYINLNWDKSDQDNWMKENFNINSAEIINWDIKIKDRNSNLVELEAQFNLYNHIKQYGNNLLVFLPGSKLPILEAPEKRKHELRIQNPIHQIDTLLYSTSQVNYNTYNLPESKLIESTFGSYELQFNMLDREIQVIKKTLIKPNRISPGEEYQKFYTFLKGIHNIEKSTYFQLTL